MTVRDDVEWVCSQYGFRVVDAEQTHSWLSQDSQGNPSEFVIQGTNTDLEWTDWIGYVSSTEVPVVLVCNTDFNNMWLYETRPDLSADDIVEFTRQLAGVFEDDELNVSSIVDPEDWQELAGVHDAYADERFTMTF